MNDELIFTPTIFNSKFFKYFISNTLYELSSVGLNSPKLAIDGGMIASLVARHQATRSLYFLFKTLIIPSCIVNLFDF